MKYIIEKVIKEYPKAKLEQFAGHPIGGFFRTDIPQRIYNTGIVDSSTHLVTGSVGQGGWVESAWFAIFDRKITTSARKGVYIVYLLSKDGNSLYLTFNQGCEDIRQSHTKKETISIMRSRAAEIRKKIDSRGFETDENVSLGENLTERAELYQKGIIFYKVYNRGEVPSEEELQSDLKNMMDIYKEYVSGEESPSKNKHIKENFRKWFAEQPQRNNPLEKYKDETIDAAIRLLERGMSRIGISKYVNLNCFDIEDYSEFKIIHDECYSYAEAFDKNQNHSDFRNGLDYYLWFLKELSGSKISGKIREIIKAYKDDFINRDKEERYKWQAVGTYKKVWNIDSPDFAEMLKSAFKETANLLKSGNYYPYKMLCIFAENEPETVQSLFELLYDESISFEERCTKFKDAFDKYFKPQHLNHYQDLHAISVYLTCEYPEKYYIYKYSIVKEFINQVQYECESIDTMTDSEKMELLLELYDTVLDVVKEDEELQEMSRERLDDSCYQDEAFHMLTHDIIYFASKYSGIDAKIGTFDSWEIVDEVTAIKTCDKSFFDYNGSGVPKGICWFFGAEELETSENKSLSLVYKGVTYDAKVQNDSTDRRRVRIFWNTELGKLLNKYKDNDVKAKFVKESESVYNIEIIGGEKEMTTKDQISAIETFIAAKGFNYDGNLVENFYLSLKSKPFVILAGTSGTGKTRLVRLFAEAISAEYNFVSVRPDWSDSSDLFGHVDLNQKFVKGDIIDFVKQAELNPAKPYILCLDEMNLARVEYYMSDILSTIETRRFENGQIVTDAVIPTSIYGNDTGAAGRYGKVMLPGNLYIVGTVNMDETTFPFSKKVLDRANTIEFSYVDLLAMPSFEKHIATAQSLTNDFLVSDYITLNDCDASDKDYIESICVKLQRINSVLETANAHIGYRVRDEIVFYMLNNKKTELLDENVAFDNQIMQKILPRIQGSSESIKKMLDELLKLCESEKYDASTKKINFMIKRYEEDGFTSYWL